MESSTYGEGRVRQLREALLDGAGEGRTRRNDCRVYPGYSESHHGAGARYSPAIPSVVFGLLFFALVFCAFTLQRPDVGSPPTCRKSASFFVIYGRNSSTGLDDSAFPGDSLVVWSGMGHGRQLASDFAVFDLNTRIWSKPCVGNGSNTSPLPRPRWKSAMSSLLDQSKVVMFGGRVLNAEGTSTTVSDDLWVLETERLRWHTANTSVPNYLSPQNNESQETISRIWPPQREGHSIVTYADRDGDEAVLIFGGRDSAKSYLGDVWTINLHEFPNVTARQLVARSTDEADKTPGFRGDVGDANKKRRGNKAPFPRSGHAAVVRDDTELAEMVVFGGRNATQYLNDLWTLDIHRGTWKEIIPQQGTYPAPHPREDATAIFYRGNLYVFGGRMGPTLLSSRPLGDLWMFSFATLQWTKVLEYEAKPAVRFLQSAVLYKSNQTASARMYIFGGESLEKCKLNDVWELRLDTLHWRLLTPNFFSKRRCDALFGT
jgi:hypothetical protein